MNTQKNKQVVQEYIEKIINTGEVANIGNYISQGGTGFQTDIVLYPIVEHRSDQRRLFSPAIFPLHDRSHYHRFVELVPLPLQSFRRNIGQPFEEVLHLRRRGHTDLRDDSS